MNEREGQGKTAIKAAGSAMQIFVVLSCQDTAAKRGRKTRNEGRYD